MKKFGLEELTKVKDFIVDLENCYRYLYHLDKTLVAIQNKSKG